jgi:predicted nucleotidyltransferase
MLSGYNIISFEEECVVEPVEKGSYPDRELLNDILVRVMSVVQPRRVILFGSAVRGKMTADSDLDLLVIVPGPAQRRLLAQAIYRKLHGILTPVDILVVTEQDVQLHGDAIGSVLRPALREGEVIYDSSQ